MGEECGRLGRRYGCFPDRTVLLKPPLDYYVTLHTSGVTANLDNCSADLLGDAKIGSDGAPIKLVLDMAALAQAEDVSIGPRLPRRGRQISN